MGRRCLYNFEGGDSNNFTSKGELENVPVLASSVVTLVICPHLDRPRRQHSIKKIGSNRKTLSHYPVVGFENSRNLKMV